MFHQNQIRHAEIPSSPVKQSQYNVTSYFGFNVNPIENGVTDASGIITPSSIHKGTEGQQ